MSTCRIAVKVVPNARKDELAGWLDETLRIRLRAPAVEGKANEACVAFLSGFLALPRRSVRIVQGEKSRQKLIEIEGLSLAEVKARLP